MYRPCPVSHSSRQRDRLRSMCQRSVAEGHKESRLPERDENIGKSDTRKDGLRNPNTDII